MAVFSKEWDPVLFPLARQMDDPLGTALYHKLGMVVGGYMSYRLGPSTSDPPGPAPVPALPAAWQGWQPRLAAAPLPGSLGAGPAPSQMC